MSDPIDLGSAVVVQPGGMVLINVPARHSAEAVQAVVERVRLEHPDIDFVVVGEGTTAEVVDRPADTGPAVDVDGLDNMFTSHAPQGDDVAAYQRIREAGKALAEAIVADAPPSRERSTALVKVREAVMWANAARACNPPPE